jgi:hypothetical protein
MKKIKFFLIATSITMAVGGALAHEENKKAYCDYFPQYIPQPDGSFAYAGQLGVNYFCLTSIGTCTYYQPTPWSPYMPCRSGIYLRLF